MAHRTHPPEQEQQAAVAALFLAHSDRVRGLIAAALRPADQHLADDFAQDVWLTLWRMVLRGDTIARPAGLLATLARHRVIDHYRSAVARREVPTDTTTGALDLVRARELVAA